MTIRHGPARFLVSCALVAVLTPYGMLGCLTVAGWDAGSAWSAAPVIANAGVLAAVGVMAVVAWRSGDRLVCAMLAALAALVTAHVLISLAAGRGPALILAALRYAILPAFLLAIASVLPRLVAPAQATRIPVWLGFGSLALFIAAWATGREPFPEGFFRAKGYDAEVMRTYVFDLILPRFGGVLGDPVNLSLAAGGCAAVWSWRCLHRDNPWRGLLLCLGLLGAIVIAFGKGGPVLFVMALAAMWVLGKSLEGWIWKAPCLVVAGWMMIAGKVAVMDGFVRSTLPSAGTHATSILSIGSDGDVVALLLGHGIGTSGAFSVILGGLPYAESVARGAESAVASLVWQLGFLGVAATLAALGVLARSLSAMGLAAVPLVGVSVALLIQGMIQENAFAAAVWFAPLAVAAAGIAGSGAGMPSTNRATS